MFGLVDCNNFYASCERLFRPELNGKPVVVLSNNDGCVVARSNEAKALGIPMGAPLFDFKKLIEANNVHVFSSNYALYGDMSSRVMTVLNSLVPEMEIYSIDEAFLLMNGFEHLGTLDEYGARIKKTVTQYTGIPVSIGFAPTKSLAKVANKIAKKFPDKTKGVYTIDSEEKRIKALKWLPVEDVWGIGRRLSKKLYALGVKTAYDFTMIEPQWIKKNMSIVGFRLQEELKGVSVLELDEVKPKQNIATTRSFETNYTKLSELEERVSTFAATCSAKLRKQKSCCKALMVFIHTNYHRKELPQYSRSMVVQLPFASNSAIVLSKYATIALEKMFKEGYLYKKAGVIVLDFVPESQVQGTLFDQPDPKHEVLMKSMDAINRAIGKTSLKLASQDVGRTWKMKQEKLSPRYTTRLSEVIEVM